MTARVCTAIALIAAFLTAAPLDAPAQPPPPGAPPPPGVRFAVRTFNGDMLFGEGPGLMLPLMIRHADLTDEQERRVQEILAADRDHLQELLRQLDAANDALAQKLIAPGKVDAAALQPEVERVSRLRQALMERGLKSALAIRAVLTPEQLAKAAAVQTKLRKLQAEMRELLEEK